MSSELQLDVCCRSCCSGDIWWTHTKERQAWCYLQVKLCDPRLSALSVVATIKALYKYTSFLSFYLTQQPSSRASVRIVTLFCNGSLLLAFVWMLKSSERYANSGFSSRDLQLACLSRYVTCFAHLKMPNCVQYTRRHLLDARLCFHCCLFVCLSVSCQSVKTLWFVNVNEI